MWRAVDYVLRFLYLFLAPLMLVGISQVMPIMGIMIGAGLATVVAVFGSDRWQDSVKRIRLLERFEIVGRVVGGMGRLGDYYREHPPKPLVYYIAYPLLFPYWIFNRVARREFLLYRRLNAITLVIVIITGVLDYVRNWRPIPFNYFFGVAIGTFIFQLLATFALVMPIVTTILLYHQRKLKKTLWAALACIVLTGGLGLYVVRSSTSLSVGVQTRLRARTGYFHHEAVDALAHGLDAALASFKRAPTDGAAALAAAQEAIQTLYHPDEAAAFHLYADHGVIMLFVRFKNEPPIWLAGDSVHHRAIGDPKVLPPDAQLALGLP